MEQFTFDSQSMLRGVSRTFALTIPLLPPPLRTVVGNAYLLCRIADTIEDDNALGRGDKQLFSERFINLVRGHGDAASFASELSSRLAVDTSASERELVARTVEVIAITHSFNKVQRAALARCIGIMASGMAYYQQQYSGGVGLPDMASFNHYCYCVAGVVGELLTELFCDYSPSIAKHRRELMCLATLFGQGLQMTNILKDVHEDGARGACWLPQDVFAEAGHDLGRQHHGERSEAWCAAMLQMVGLAGWYLRQAVCYSLIIPRKHLALRRFCLWAVGMAVWTLRSLARQPGFNAGKEVKISRRAVYSIGFLVQLFACSNYLVRTIFGYAARALPPAKEMNDVLSSVQRP